jgi:hypothetical protein
MAQNMGMFIAGQCHVRSLWELGGSLMGMSQAGSSLVSGARPLRHRQNRTWPRSPVQPPEVDGWVSSTRSTIVSEGTWDKVKPLLTPGVSRSDPSFRRGYPLRQSFFELGMASSNPDPMRTRCHQHRLRALPARVSSMVSRAVSL